MVDTLSDTAFDQALDDKTIDTPHAEDDWETLVSKGVHLKDAEDATQWAKGDLCSLVDRRYGEGSIPKFAEETKLGAAKTLYEQAQIADFYLPTTRTLNPTLKWEHYRKAFRAVKHAEHKLEMPGVTATNWLEQAEKNGWSAVKMEREMKLALGQEARERWRFQPKEIQVRDEGYVILILPDEELERLKQALAYQGNDRFEVVLNLSYIHPAEAKG